MKKSELIDEIQRGLSGEVRLSMRDINGVLDSLSVVVASALDGGDEVSLPGIGKLSVKDRAAREGRNPATGEAIAIPAKRVVHFSAAKALKDGVSG